MAYKDLDAKAEACRRNKKAHRLRAKALGLCTVCCKAPKRATGSTCQRCYDRARSGWKLRYERFRAARGPRVIITKVTRVNLTYPKAKRLGMRDPLGIARSSWWVGHDR